MTTLSRPAAIRPSRLCVVGAGYVGLTAAACMAESGHTVTCLETNPARLAVLEQGGIPIVEPGLPEIVARNREAGRLRFGNDVAEAIDGVEHAFLCVGTPPRADGTPDLTQIAAAARALAAAANSDLVLVVKSTVPPGTCEALEILATEAARPDIRVRVVSNPEFLRESRAVEDFFAPDRIVVGADEPELGRAIADLYPAGSPVVLCDRRSAELIKYASNTFLAVKISFANEVAGLCELLGADSAPVLEGVGLDGRIGTAFLGPGAGFGGSCLPKDLSGFLATAASLGYPAPVAAAALAVNDRAPEAVVDKLDLALDGLRGRRLAVLGVAFKPGTDDTRDSPAIALIGRLAAAGAIVRVHDPLASCEGLPAEACPDPYSAVLDAEAVVIATGWPQFADLDPRRMREAMAGSVVVDGVGILRGQGWREAGFSLYGVGWGLPTRLHPVVWQAITWAVPEAARADAA
ncbi:MAG: UDP-glucose dehydrogenase family protein [Candidatus Limnocylindrales bacterium]